jgi:hypothetical protein
MVDQAVGDEITEAAAEDRPPRLAHGPARVPRRDLHLRVAQVIDLSFSYQICV